MQIDPRRLVVLRAVARTGGVVAAAPALHLTPSAVSQHIARLESEVGVTLLDRSQLGGRRAVRLTEAGRLLATHADRLVEVLSAAETDLTALTGQVTGPVTVGAFPTAIAHLVTPAAVAVAATVPAVQVGIRQVETKPGLTALRAGLLDLLVTESTAAEPPSPGRDVSVVRLLDDPYLIAIPDSWPVAAGVEDLLDRPWVDGPPGSTARHILDQLQSRYGGTMERAHECLEFPTALGLVSAGLAAAVVPTLAVSGQSTGIRMVADSALGARRLDVRFRYGRHEPSPATRVALAAIRAAAARMSE